MPLLTRHFFATFDYLIALTSNLDALIFRSGDFCADKQTLDRQTKLITFSLAHVCMRGK